jgi:hypothetical protein
VVVLRSVNALAAAQTDRYVSGAAVRPASSNSPCSDEEFFNYSILRLVWSRSPHFPRAGVLQDQSQGDSEGYGRGRFGVHGGLRGAGRSRRLTFKHLPRRSPWSEAAGPFGHAVKCGHLWGSVGSAPQPQAAQHSPPRWASALGFRVPPAAAYLSERASPDPDGPKLPRNRLRLKR